MEEVLVWVIEEEAVAVVEDNVAKEREMVVVDDDAMCLSFFAKQHVSMVSF